MVLPPLRSERKKRGAGKKTEGAATVFKKEKEVRGAEEIEGASAAGHSDGQKKK